MATVLLRPPRLVAVTGFGHEHDHARSKQSGFFAHLVKPVDLRQLLELVRGAPGPESSGAKAAARAPGTGGGEVAP